MYAKYITHSRVPIIVTINFHCEMPPPHSTFHTLTHSSIIVHQKASIASCLLWLVAPTAVKMVRVLVQLVKCAPALPLCRVHGVAATVLACMPDHGVCVSTVI